MELVNFPKILHPKSSQVLRITTSPSWIDPIVAYISDGTLLKDRKEAETVRRKSSTYQLSAKKKLYK